MKSEPWNLVWQQTCSQTSSCHQVFVRTQKKKLSEKSYSLHPSNCRPARGQFSTYTCRFPKLKVPGGLNERFLLVLDSLVENGWNIRYLSVCLDNSNSSFLLRRHAVGVTDVWLKYVWRRAVIVAVQCVSGGFGGWAALYHWTVLLWLRCVAVRTVRFGQCSPGSPQTAADWRFCQCLCWTPETQRTRRTRTVLRPRERFRLKTHGTKSQVIQFVAVKNGKHRNKLATERSDGRRTTVTDEDWCGLMRTEVDWGRLMRTDEDWWGLR